MNIQRRPRCRSCGRGCRTRSSRHCAHAASDTLGDTCRKIRAYAHAHSRRRRLLRRKYRIVHRRNNSRLQHFLLCQHGLRHPLQHSLLCSHVLRHPLQQSKTIHGEPAFHSAFLPRSLNRIQFRHKHFRRKNPCRNKCRRFHLRKNHRPGHDHLRLPYICLWYIPLRCAHLKARHAALHAVDSLVQMHKLIRQLLYASADGCQPAGDIVHQFKRGTYRRHASSSLPAFACGLFIRLAL